jgi:phage/plasmid-associated DNA primase
VRDRKLETEVNKVLFENPYNNPLVGKFYKYCIARAMAGNIEDKIWISIVGNPNCGKGVMTTALTCAFDEYVGAYNPNVLKFNPRDSIDEARKLAWYVPLIGCRIALGNEVRLDGKGLDGNQMKTLSSGGDTLLVRQNFKDQVNIEMITTFILLVNDMPPIMPCDSALRNRLKCIPHTKSFVIKPQV